MMLLKSKNLCLFVLLLIVSCTGNKLKLDDKNFTDEIEQQQNLVLNFNKDLVPDSLLNVWLDTSYIKFTPEVKGKFKWTAKDEITFSPDISFMPSTDYKGEVTEKIFLHADKKYSLSDELNFSFHTPYLTLSGNNIFWTKNETNRSLTELRLELNFNAKVNPADLKNILQVSIGGQPQNFTFNSTAVSDKITLSVPEGSANFDDKDLKITIAAGLKCAESPYISKEPLKLESTVPSKANFQIIGLEALYEEQSGYINVSTNQEVADQNLAALITIEPKTTITTELHNSGFYIKGDFKEGSSYRISIKKEIKGIFGGMLKEDFGQDVVFGAQEPNISFLSSKGVYLTSKGEKNVAVRIINVPDLKVKIYKIYENNILQFLKGNMYNNDDYYYEDYYGGDSYTSSAEELGDLVLERDYHSKNLKKSGGAHLLNLNFDEINAYKGFYVVNISSTEKQWIKANKIVSISDIGLIVKETENDIYVFSNSILNASSIQGVQVNLISTNNQSVYKATTDGNGVAKFEDIKKKAPGFKIKMITCNYGEDFNYLHFDETRVETSQYDIGGSFTNSSGYDAFIYGDREIYRPGETIYLNTIVRNQKWEPLKKVPIKIKVILPNGKEFTSIKGILNNEGAFETKVILPATTVTGSYNVEVYSANDVLLNSKFISVEEFIPDRIKVTSVLSADALKTNQSLVATATALNLFGPPAANRNYEMEMSLNTKYFSPKEYSDYNFSISSISTSYFPSELRQGQTDDDGKAEETFLMNPAYKNSGILEGKIFTTVFDESGRPVHQVKRFDVITQDVFYGIKYFDYYVGTNEPLIVPLIAVNKDGKALSAAAHVQVIRYNWQTVLEKNYSGYRYVSQKKEEILEDKTININGTNTNYTFKPVQSGEYEIRVKQPGVDSYVMQYFYAYGWGTTQNSSFEVDKEGKVTIELDKDKYEVGDDAKVLFKTPFPGKMLVTVERGNVYDYFFVETDKKSASLTIPIKEEYLPNVYISATLIKPNGESSIPLTVGHGYKALLVENKATKLPLEITSVEKSRSNSKQTICVKSKPESDIEVTFAVVDEGILQLKNTQTPDPYEFFFRKKALEVNSYDIYLKLLPELSGKKSSVAGDGYNLSKRANPLANKRVKLVSFWSGIKKTDSDGKACFDVNIPQFSGDLRIMAVAYKGNAFGSTTKNMKVADPMVVSTSLPRFLSPKDTMLVPVTLTNTTANSTEATAQISVSGPLEIIGGNSQKVTVKANSEGRVEFKVYAKPEIGIGKVTTDISALNEKFKEEIEITVRPPSSLIKVSGSGQISAGSTEKPDITNSLIPSSVSGKLIVSKSPIIQFADNLDYLLGYPHGCVEQTVSKAFPQLYFNDLVKSINAKRKDLNDPNQNVQEAIRKLSAMQLNNGALSYWLGGYEESWWGTVYAAHFLYEAKKAGFEVNNNILDKIYGYLQMKVKEKKMQDYYYYENNTYRTKQIASKEIFYSLFVLASVGRQDLSIMNYYKANKSLLALDSKYMLASTYMLLGDQASDRSLLPAAFEGEKSINAFGGSFYSYIRDMAISLNMLVETDPKNPQVGILTQHLSKLMKEQPYLSTQERAFAFIALGKVAKLVNESNVTAEIKVGGKSAGTYKSGTFVISDNINKGIEISVKGSGSLYYFWQLEGLSADGKVKEEDSFLKIRKAFFDRNGRALSGNTFQQNDLIVVKLTVATVDQSSVDNMVITDILPAGFEIENPRLTESAEMQWIKDAAYPEHFDIRDDRINLFTSVSGTQKTFYYVVRAVSKGTFIMGPASADAMYNGEYHSYSGAGSVKVK